MFILVAGLLLGLIVCVCVPGTAFEQWAAKVSLAVTRILSSRVSPMAWWGFGVR